MLNKISETFIRILINNIRNNNKSASGNLINSISYNVIDNIDVKELQIYAEDYLKNVVDGRRPHTKKVPIKAIKEWLTLKNLPQVSPWAIQTNIWKFGIEPTDIFSSTENSFFNSGEKLIDDYFIEDINEKIEEMFKNKTN